MLAIDFGAGGEVVIAGRLDASQSATAQAFLDKVGDTDAYLDGPDFQRAMDRMMDTIAAAVKR